MGELVFSFHLSFLRIMAHSTNILLPSPNSDCVEITDLIRKLDSLHRLNGSVRLPQVHRLPQPRPQLQHRVLLKPEKPVLSQSETQTICFDAENIQNNSTEDIDSTANDFMSVSPPTS